MFGSFCFGFGAVLCGLAGLPFVAVALGALALYAALSAEDLEGLDEEEALDL